MLSKGNYISRVVSSWKVAFGDRLFTIKFFLYPGLFLLYSAITQKLGTYVELRKGVRLDDKFLYLFPRIDFSVEIFVLLYTSLLLVVISHLHKPKVISRIIEMHFLVAVVRQVCILLVALEPPAGLIVLRDVFLENTVYPRMSPLTKDLFFSGHVASIWLYFLCATHKGVKTYLVGATLLMSFFICCMRVHYTYDVYAAIIFTTIIFKAPFWIKSNVLSKSMPSEPGI